MLGWTRDPKVILGRCWGGQKIQKLSQKDVEVDKRSKSYPRKMLGWTKDPKVILERCWGGQRIQKLSQKDFEVDDHKLIRISRSR